MLGMRDVREEGVMPMEPRLRLLAGHVPRNLVSQGICEKTR